MPTSNFSAERKTIGLLLENFNLRFEVPPYQREYSWSGAEIEQLWEDINFATKTDSYFFGAVVFKEINGQENYLEIIDGQQRLASITILLAVIRDKFRELTENDSANAMQRYIVTQNTRGQKTYRLKLNKQNWRFFQQYVQDEGPNRTLLERTVKSNKEKSNQLIIDAYKYLNKVVGDKLSSIPVHENKKEYLLRLDECVRANLSMIEIKVNDEAEAYLIFETLNDRGLELSTIDLVKNYLFARLSVTELASMQEFWGEIRNLVGITRLNYFLRYFWSASRKFVREKTLFKELKSELGDNNEKKIQFIENVKEYAVIFEKLISPTLEYWDGNKRIVEKIKVLFSILRIRQVTPLILTAKIKFNAQNFEQLLELVIILSFRYSTICGKNTNKLERVYADLASKINSGEITAVTEIKSELKSVYPEDEEFIKNFSEKEMTDSVLAKYVLKKIEEHEQSAQTAMPPLSPADDIITLEHIFPKNPNAYWKNLLEEGIKTSDVVDRIGNLTLLTSDDNNIAANDPLNKKCEIFATSSFFISKKLSSLQTWNATLINSRQSELGYIAAKIWKIDF